MLRQRLRESRLMGGWDMPEKNAKFGRIGAAIFMILAVAVGISGHSSDHFGIPLVTDWSHRHVIFSTPQNFEQALRVQKDPRYLQQWVRRNVHPRFPGERQRAMRWPPTV